MLPRSPSSDSRSTTPQQPPLPEIHTFRHRQHARQSSLARAMNALLIPPPSDPVAQEMKIKL